MEPSSDNLDSDISESSLDSDMSELSLDRDISESSLDSDISESSLDSDMPESSLDSDMSESSLDNDISESSMDRVSVLFETRSDGGISAESCIEPPFFECCDGSLIGCCLDTERSWYGFLLVRMGFPCRECWW